MKTYICLLIFFLFSVSSYPQKLNFIIINGNLKISSGSNFNFENTDFVLLSGKPDSKNFENAQKIFQKEIPDSIPFFVFPKISYREYLIENFVNDETNWIRNFALWKNNSLIFGLNQIVTNNPKIEGMPEEDKAKISSVLSQAGFPENLYIISFTSESNNLNDFISTLPDSLLPAKIYFIPLNKIFNLSRKSPVIRVEIKGNKLKLKKGKKYFKSLTITALQKRSGKKSKKNSFKILFEKESNTLSFIQPVYRNGKFYFAGMNGLVTCIDSTGKELWKYDAGATLISPMLYFRNYLIFTTLEGDVIILDNSTGEQIESLGVDEAIVTSPVLFTYKGDKNLLYDIPKNKPNSIAFGTASGKIFAYSIPAFEELWINPDNTSNIAGKLISANNKLLFFNSNGILFNLDPFTGWTNWKWKSGKQKNVLASDLLSDNKSVYFVLTDGKLYKIDILLGSKIFGTKTGIKNAAISFGKGGTILVGGNKALKKFSIRSGKIIKTYNIGEKQIAFGSKDYEGDGKIFFGIRSGNVYQFSHGKINLLFYSPVKPLRYVRQAGKNKFIIFDIYNNYKMLELTDE